MISILDIDDVYKIPLAYEKLIHFGKIEALKGPAESHTNPAGGESDQQKADECYRKMIKEVISGVRFTLT